MSRIAQAFTLAERYVGAYERYVDETVRRYGEVRLVEERNATNGERMTDTMRAKVHMEEDLVPRIGDLAKQVADLASHLAKFDARSMLDGLRALLPNGAATEGNAK